MNRYYPYSLVAVFALGALLGTLALLNPSCKSAEPARDGAITFVVPTPEPVRIFWIDSGGNIGLRGALAVVPGLPSPGSKISPACEKSATANGQGTLTVCMEPIVGKTLAEKLDLDTWTSGTSPKP